MDRPISEFSSVSDGATFLYRPHEILPDAFEIMCKTGTAMQTIGEYVVLDKAEDRSLSEKKIINLIALMNGRSEMIDVAAENQRLYFHVIPRAEDSPRQQIVFRARGLEGVTQENALLTIEKGYWS